MSSRITTKVYIKANSINKPKKMIQNFTLTRAETLKTSNQDQLYLEWVIGKQHFFIFILKTAWKRVKSVLNFENETKRFVKFENLFFFYAFWNFLKTVFFSMRFKIWKIVLKFFTTIFEKILFAQHYACSSAISE